MGGSVQKFALISIVIGLLVLGLKYAAYHLTGSIALFSDALESIINVVTAFAALIAIRASAKPADADHHYGHSKVEYFSTVLEGALICIAAVLILREAYYGMLSPKAIDAPWHGLLINGAATIINGVWCKILLYQGRRHRSPALIADGRHLLADVITSAGVLVGVLLVALTGLLILDSVVAALVALNILWSGWHLIRESIGGLMDEAVTPDVLIRIREIISANAGEAIEAHDLRTRYAGRQTFVDFHLVVSGTMSVTQAHEICDRIERALKDEIDEALITIHVEPEGKAKHSGILVL